MNEVPDYGPISDDEIQKPFHIQRFQVDHETYGPVSGVTCSEWQKEFRYCYFYRRNNIQRSCFTDGSTFVGPVTMLDGE